MSESRRAKGLFNNIINKLPLELHIPGYQYCGPGTKLAKRLARGDSEWYTIDPNTLWDLIVVKLGALILGGEKFHDSIITINNLATVLDISHKELSWWFKVPGDLEPSPNRYIFSGDLLIEMYPEIYDKYVVQNGLHLPVYPSMGPELCYSILIPSEWVRVRTSSQIINLIFRDISQKLLHDDDYEIDGSEIIIDEVTTNIIISNQCLTWTFMKQADIQINNDDYVTIGDWISGLFRRMINFYRQRQTIVVAIQQVNTNNVLEDEGFFENDQDDD
ncbi:uncharacterized protein LOC141525915 [Cotesia typhae]|uniref:uncharacterized protein LOC141525915 n=1 Tax=Cotesia typhae TaxID=2053667 RepID=UPI003D69C211